MLLLNVLKGEDGGDTASDQWVHDKWWRSQAECLSGIPELLPQFHPSLVLGIHVQQSLDLQVVMLH